MPFSIETAFYRLMHQYSRWPIKDIRILWYSVDCINEVDLWRTNIVSCSGLSRVFIRTMYPIITRRHTRIQRGTILLRFCVLRSSPTVFCGPFFLTHLLKRRKMNKSDWHSRHQYMALSLLLSLKLYYKQRVYWMSVIERIKNSAWVLIVLFLESIYFIHLITVYVQVHVHVQIVCTSKWYNINICNTTISFYIKKYVSFNLIHFFPK